MDASPPCRIVGLVAIACALLASISFARPASHVLTFDERVAAQEAIERVYHSHQVGTRRAVHEVVTRVALERKVRTYLEESVALEEFWQTPVTTTMLQAESDRIVRGTRFPDRLREIYRALGDDALLIQECFVRPVLVHRLSRNFFAFDPRIHAEARSRAEALKLDLDSRRLDPLAEHCLRTVADVGEEIAAGDSDRPGPGRPLAISPEAFQQMRDLVPGGIEGPSSLQEERGAFQIRALLAEDGDRLRVAVYTVPKIAWADWWQGTSRLSAPEDSVASANPSLAPIDLPAIAVESAVGCPADDGWMPTAIDMPPPRDRLAAVWTGTRMIVWGGYDGRSLDTGGVYDPLTDSWTQVTTSGAPTGRLYHSAVWTGQEMIVWGGSASTGGGTTNSGGRYDPETDSWTPTAISGAPTARTLHSAVWTGAEMIVWGGLGGGQLGNGSRYDPATDTWSAINLAGAPAARYAHVAIWTGTEMLVWGGDASVGSGGARYDPSTDTWMTMTTVGAPAGRRDASAVWTGDEMVIWGGTTGAYFDSGGRYDPGVDIWTSTSGAGAPSPRAGHVAAWTGSQMLVWGGEGSSAGALGNGSRYDPATDSWMPLAGVGAASPRTDGAGVWTGDRLLVWGGRSSSQSVDYPARGGRYDPSTDTWTPISAGTVPSSRAGHSLVWTGNEMIVWGGATRYAFAYFDDGGRYDPLTDSWSAVSDAGAPSARSNHTAVWSGEQMLVWGGYGGQTLGDGAAYDPTSDSWVPLGTLGAPARRRAHTAIWSGDRMIIWGGLGALGDELATGGRYEPSSGTWSETSIAGAPTGRYGHSAVWSGGQMLIWGGREDTTFTNTGGRYHPATDEWHPTSMVGAPTVRAHHAAISTGSQMIVWGGANSLSYPVGLGTGGIYDPVLDTWSETSNLGAPSPRSGASAIWTGRQMVVFGGSSYLTFANTGGRYDPAADTWTPTSLIDAPEPRSGHPALWTGTQMLIWGGSAPSWGLMTGGVYVLDQLDDGDGDGLNDCAGDCDDTNPATYPGASEICDGRDNDCNGMLPPPESTDADVDGSLVCIDCDDEDVDRFPGNPESCDGVDNDCDATVDTFGTACGIGVCVAAGFCSGGVDSCTPGAPSAEACDRLDNDCDGTLPTGEIDDDGDGVEECFGDCDDARAATNPGAPEVNDAFDNQCPGDPGHGLVDEISGAIGFFTVSNPTEICWPAQTGATEYHVSRSLDPKGASTGCDGAVVTASCWQDPEAPAPREAFYYLVRSSSPYAGSWGAGSDLVERAGLCQVELECADGLDEDLDGATDCDDVTDCYGHGPCLSRTFSFIDTTANNVATTALFTFLQPLPLSTSDYLWFALDRPALPDIEFCLRRADFYRDAYLALAANQGIVESGGWEKYHRDAQGAWVGPITGSHENWFGGDCSGAYSWCPEAGLGGYLPGVAPGELSVCEAFENIECSDGTWRLTIRVGVDRLSGCGF